MPALLRDMRWAYEHAGDADAGTAQQELFRHQLVTDGERFIARLERHEREFEARCDRDRVTKRAAAGGSGRGVVPPAPAGVGTEVVPGQPPPAAADLPDMGTAACLELVERLLSEWGERAEAEATR